MDNKSFTSVLAKRMNRDYSSIAKLIEGFSGIVKEQCAAEGKVAIPGFGTFAGVKHDETISRDLSSGKQILLPPSIEVEFTAGSRLKKSIENKTK